MFKPISSGGGGVWGSITGTLSAQTDLQNALDAKLSTSIAASTYVPYTGATTDLNLGAHNLYATKIGLDSTDYINWTDNTTLSLFVGGTSRATLSNAGLLTLTGGVSATTGTFSNATGVACSNINAYSGSTLTFKGRVAGSGIAEHFKFQLYSAQTVTENDDTLSFYKDNSATVRTGGVDTMYGFFFQRKGVKQTTDATQTAITLSNGSNGSTSVITTETGKVYQIKARVVGKGTTNYGGTEIYGTFKNVAGTVTQIGTTQYYGSNQTGSWGTAGKFADFTISGTDIRVSVTGASETINWKTALEFLAY